MFDVSGLQSVTNSTTLVPITFFSGFHLEPSSVYEIAFKTRFYVDGPGGLKLSTANGLLNGQIICVFGGTDTAEAPFNTYNALGSFYNEAAAFGVVNVSCHGIISTSPIVEDQDGDGNSIFINPATNKPLLSFAQSSASADGTVYANEFLGEGQAAYFGYRKLK
jgi:hypothetical protein